MTENTPRSLDAIHADIAEHQNQHKALVAERERLIEQLASGNGNETAEEQVAVLAVRYDVMLKRLERLEDERYAATKADVVAGYHVKYAAAAEARTAAKSAYDEQTQLFADIERLKTEAANKVAKARAVSDEKVRARKSHLQQAALSTGYGQRLLDDIAEAVAAIELEYGEGDAVNRARNEQHQRQRNEARAAAEQARQQRFDDNWERYDEKQRAIRGNQQ